MTKFTKAFLITISCVCMTGLAIGLPVGLSVSLNKKDSKHYVHRVINNGIWKHLYGKGVYYYDDFQYLLFNYENYAALVGVQNPEIFTNQDVKEIKLVFRLNYDDSIYSLHRIDHQFFLNDQNQEYQITNNASLILPGTCDMLSVNNVILDENNIKEVLKNQPPFFPKGFSKIVIPNPVLSKLINDNFELIFGNNYTKQQVDLNLEG